MSENIKLIKDKISELEQLLSKASDELDKINQGINKLTDLRANSIAALNTMNGQKQAFQSTLALLEVPAKDS